MVFDLEAKFLFLRSAKPPRDPARGWVWSFPQGGVKEGESAITALSRELKEETGIKPEDTLVTKLCYVDQIDIPKVKRGFRKGKQYFYFSVIVLDRRVDVRLDPEEASDYRWVSRSELPELIKDMDLRKRRSIMSALQRL